MEEPQIGHNGAAGSAHFKGRFWLQGSNALIQTFDQS